MACEFNEYEVVDSCLLCGSSHLSIIDTYAHISQCRDCLFKFVTPRPTQTAIHNYYNTTENYDHWLAEQRERDVLWSRRFSIISRLLQKGSLLDVGAGIGTFLGIARKNGFDVQGTEVSGKAISITRNLYGLDLLHGTLEEQKFKASSFDVVTLWHVLEHVPFPLKTLYECNRILKPKGYLIIAVPNDDSLAYLINAIRGQSRYEPLHTAEEIHLVHFSSRTLKRILTMTGFAEELSTLDNHFAVQTALRRLYYHMCLLLKAVTGKNYFSTILSISRKC